MIAQPLNADGEFLDGEIGILEFSGTETDFSTFSISGVPGKDSALSLLFIDASLSDGFICILDVQHGGRSVLLSTNNSSGFSFRECPE